MCLHSLCERRKPTQKPTEWWNFKVFQNLPQSRLGELKCESSSRNPHLYSQAWFVVPWMSLFLFLINSNSALPWLILKFLLKNLFCLSGGLCPELLRWLQVAVWCVPWLLPHLTSHTWHSTHDIPHSNRDRVEDRVSWRWSALTRALQSKKSGPPKVTFQIVVGTQLSCCWDSVIRSP